MHKSHTHIHTHQIQRRLFLHKSAAHRHTISGVFKNTYLHRPQSLRGCQTAQTDSQKRAGLDGFCQPLSLTETALGLKSRV